MLIAVDYQITDLVCEEQPLPSVNRVYQSVPALGQVHFWFVEQLLHFQSLILEEVMQ